jgi:hypothetical protein
MTSGVTKVDRRVLFLIFAVQALLCYNFYHREIANYAPSYYDQTAFLNEAYSLQEKILTNGFPELWNAVWSPQHFSGLALPIEGALSGLLLPGARLPQLALAFVMFCTLQFVTFSTAKKIWKSSAYGYMALGLILCQVSPWNGAGGLFDFRLDFFAYCLYGIWAWTVMRSELFLDRRWAIGAGLVGALLILHRFISSIYLIGIYAGFAAICTFLRFRWRRDPDRSHRMLRRLSNLGLSAVVLAIITAPILIRNYNAMRSYYMIGHAISNEKYVRAREFGITNLIGHLNYYPISVVRDHLGSVFFLGSAMAIVSSLVARILNLRDTSRADQRFRDDETFFLQVLFLTGLIMWPITVLTADISKSPVVGGIVGVPITIFMVVVAARIAPILSPTRRSLVDKFVMGCSLVIFALGLSTEFVYLTQHRPEYVYRRDRRKLAEVNEWIFDYAQEHHWKNPTISFDTLEKELNSGTISAIGYEQSQAINSFQPLLGNGVMGVDLPEALSLLAKSDFLVLTSSPKKGVYPFYEHIAQYWEDLKAWADKNMSMVHTTQLDGYTATVYVRPTTSVPDSAGKSNVQ